MNNLLIIGTILKEKAISYVQELQVEEFHASNGWFERWKARYNISFKAIAGEGKAITPKMTRERTMVRSHLNKFSVLYENTLQLKNNFS